MSTASTWSRDQAVGQVERVWGQALGDEKGQEDGMKEAGLKMTATKRLGKTDFVELSGWELIIHVFSELVRNTDV